MSWIRDGETVDAIYMGEPVSGLVLESRVKYGGTVQYTVELETPIQLPWRSEPTNRVLVTEKELIS